jgi:hypothetical protein
MSEYAFDVTLSAVVRANAATREEAEAAVREIVAYDAHAQLGDGSPVVLTEVSYNEGAPLHLFEVDDKNVEDQEGSAPDPVRAVRDALAALHAASEGGSDDDEHAAAMGLATAVEALLGA